MGKCIVARRTAVAVMTLCALLTATFTSTAAAAPAAASPHTVAGCTDWPTSKFLQTPLTSGANGGQGFAMQNGSYYGEGFHINCNDATHMNQYYALDLGMRLGDQVLSPGGAGTVHP